jgi:hypothetical protein
MLGGAVAGALLLKASLGLALALTGGLMLLVQIAYLPAARR